MKYEFQKPRARLLARILSCAYRDLRRRAISCQTYFEITNSVHAELEAIEIRVDRRDLRHPFAVSGDWRFVGSVDDRDPKGGWQWRQ